MKLDISLFIMFFGMQSCTNTVLPGYQKQISPHSNCYRKRKENVIFNGMSQTLAHYFCSNLLTKVK